HGPSRDSFTAKTAPACSRTKFSIVAHGRVRTRRAIGDADDARRYRSSTCAALGLTSTVMSTVPCRDCARAPLATMTNAANAPQRGSTRSVGVRRCGRPVGDHETIVARMNPGDEVPAEDNDVVIERYRHRLQHL